MKRRVTDAALLVVEVITVITLVLLMVEIRRAHV